ncbi:MAG: hypothetical protein ACRD2P_08940 [Terriglobia bacterium]
MKFPEDYLHVRGWEKFQYRTDRPMSWIKLHVGLLQDPDFLKLSRAQRYDLIAIWVLSAAQMHPGWVANDPQTLRKCGALGERLNLQEFIDKGFLEKNGALEKSREEKSRVDARMAPKKQATEPSKPFAFEADFLKVTEEQDRTLAEAFHWVEDRQAEYRKMAAWQAADPGPRKGMSAYNWFSRIAKPEAPKPRKEGWDTELNMPLAERPF